MENKIIINTHDIMESKVNSPDTTINVIDPSGALTYSCMSKDIKSIDVGVSNHQQGVTTIYCEINIDTRK